MFVDSACKRPYGLGIGYGCCKVKIYRILKGNLKPGYINAKTNSPYKEEVIINNGQQKDMSGSIGFEGRFVFKMKLTDAEECFTTENKGVYTPVGKVYQLESVGMDMHYKMVDGKKTIYNSTKAFYKILYSCCEVNSGNK